MSPDAKPSLDRRGLAHLLIAMLLGATTIPAIRIAVGPAGGFAPLQMGMARFAVSAALLLAGLAVARGGLRVAWRAAGWTTLAGAILWGGGNGLSAIAARDSSAGMVALFLAMGPLFVLALDGLLARAWPRRGEIGALAFGLVGIGLLSWKRLSGGAINGAGAPTLPFWSLIGAPFAQAVGIVMLRRSKRPMAPTLSTALQLVGGAVALTVAHLATGEHSAMPTRAGLMAWIYLTLVASLVAFRSYTVAMQRLPTPIFLTHSWVTPLLASGLAVAFLGERWTSIDSAAAASIVAGLVMLIRVRRNLANDAHRNATTIPTNVNPIRTPVGCSRSAARESAAPVRTAG